MYNFKARKEPSCPIFYLHLGEVSARLELIFAVFDKREDWAQNELEFLFPMEAILRK